MRWVWTAAAGGGCLDHCASAWQSAMASQTAWFGIRVHAGLEPADGDDLVSGPDSDGEGAGAVVQDGKGAVGGLLQGRDDAAVVHPNEGVLRRSPGSSSGSWQPSCAC
jgi:hypothetical protein